MHDPASVILCDYQQQAGGYVCARCGDKRKKRVQRNCPGEIEPSIIAQGVRYVRAFTRWMLAGRPERSEAEVERIFTDVCTPCEFFRAKDSTCKVCGCRLGGKPGALLNKIQFATESCPKGKW